MSGKTKTGHDYRGILWGPWRNRARKMNYLKLNKLEHENVRFLESAAARSPDSFDLPIGSSTAQHSDVISWLAQLTSTEVLLIVQILTGVWVLFVVLRTNSRLRRLERRIRDPKAVPGEEAASDGSELAEGSHGSGAFERFLDEDPARRELPKSEQFAAYRKWRKDSGLNWQP